MTADCVRLPDDVVAEDDEATTPDTVGTGSSVLTADMLFRIIAIKPCTGKVGERRRCAAELELAGGGGDF